MYDWIGLESDVIGNWHVRGIEEAELGDEVEPSPCPEDLDEYSEGPFPFTPMYVGYSMDLKHRLRRHTRSSLLDFRAAPAIRIRSYKLSSPNWKAAG